MAIATNLSWVELSSNNLNPGINTITDDKIAFARF